jgi:hypothetical protein
VSKVLMIQQNHLESGALPYAIVASMEHPHVVLHGLPLYQDKGEVHLVGFGFADVQEVILRPFELTSADDVVGMIPVFVGGGREYFQTLPEVITAEFHEEA